MRTIVWAVVLGSVLSAGPDPAAVKVQGPDTLGTAVPFVAIPSGASSLSPVQANQAGTSTNAIITLTIPAVAGKFNYITGFECGNGGATTATSVTVTIAGVQGGTMSYIYAVPTPASSATNTLQVEFTSPIPSSAVNTAIVLTVPALGAGNTASYANLHGFTQ